MKLTFKILALVTCLLASRAANAEVIYRFTGVVPDADYVDYVGTYFQSIIKPGDTFVAELTMDVTIDDYLSNDPTRGQYNSSVLGGTFSFSRGSTVTYEGTYRAGGVTNTYNDYNVYKYDGIYVTASAKDINDQFLTRVNFGAQTDDLSAMASDAMPTPFTTFGSSPVQPRQGLYGMWIFRGNDYVRYGLLDANNTMFFAVPEPSSGVIWSILAALGCCVYWWRRRK